MKAISYQLSAISHQPNPSGLRPAPSCFSFQFSTFSFSRRRSGTTIIELVMAIVILSVGLPPLLKAFQEGAIHTRRGGQATKAAFLAIERMEEIMATRYASTSGYSNVNSANFPDNNTAITGFTQFKRTVTISYVTASLTAAGSDVGYKKVQVKVTWNSGAEQMIVERVFADFGI